VADDNEVPEVTLSKTIKTFSKRPIEQLDIIKEIDVLVSLSGTYTTCILSNLKANIICL
jgi:hypothetical protein